MDKTKTVELDLPERIKIAELLGFEKKIWDEDARGLRRFRWHWKGAGYGHSAGGLPDFYNGSEWTGPLEDKLFELCEAQERECQFYYYPAWKRKALLISHKEYRPNGPMALIWIGNKGGTFWERIDYIEIPIYDIKQRQAALIQAIAAAQKEA